MIKVLVMCTLIHWLIVLVLGIVDNVQLEQLKLWEIILLGLFAIATGTGMLYLVNINFIKGYSLFSIPWFIIAPWLIITTFIYIPLIKKIFSKYI